MMSRRLTAGRGFSLLELALVVGVVSLLVVVLVSRLLLYYENAERVAAQQLIGTLRTALAMRSAQLIATGETGRLVALVDANPMVLLSETPRNYLGELYAPTLADLPNGQWFFDRSDRTLVYLFNAEQKFSFQTSKFLKFKVKLAGLPKPSDQQGRSGLSTGVTLDQVSNQAAIQD